MNDGISLIQTAEGVTEVYNILGRMRELAVQKPARHTPLVTVLKSLKVPTLANEIKRIVCSELQPYQGIESSTMVLLFR